MSPVVACIGETMAVVAPDSAVPLLDADSFTLSAGGAESNVAAGLAERGTTALWLSRLGEDTAGDRVLTELTARGVDTSWVIRDPEAQTGIYLKDPRSGDRRSVWYYRSGSAASRMSPADIDSWPLNRVDWVHVSGITAALSASCDAMLDRLTETAAVLGFGVSFDVNFRPALWTRERAALRCLAIGNSCDVVLVGLDEAQALWAVDDAADVAALFPRARSVVVKDGAHDATEFVRPLEGAPAVHRVPAVPVEVVEAVGAGDAFAAGFLDGYLRGHPPATRLMSGHSAAGAALRSLTDSGSGRR